MKERNNHQLAVHVSAVSIVWNVILSVFKVLAGILGHSSAMISDAVHSASDVFSTIIVIIGVKISAKKSDSSHQYGHERFECIAAILLSVVLALTGLAIGWTGIKAIISGDYNNIAMPGTIALIAAIVSIAVKEAMYWYTRNAAKKINSTALMADAWHHRSDALSSIGSFAGILGSRLFNFPLLDPIASVVICFFILKVSVDIFRSSTDKMTDHACDEKTLDKIRNLIIQQDGVMGIDQLKTRLFGDRIYVDVEICADGEKTLNVTHAIAQRVHDEIEKDIPNVKHCMVHVNPAQKD